MWKLVYVSKLGHVCTCDFCRTATTVLFAEMQSWCKVVFMDALKLLLSIHTLAVCPSRLCFFESGFHTFSFLLPMAFFIRAQLFLHSIVSCAVCFFMCICVCGFLVRQNVLSL
jgi:hypothetical protein